MSDFFDTPQSYCLCGFARRDITPPVGMYHRMWGAATEDVSIGVHSALWAFVLVLQEANATDENNDAIQQRKILVVLDHCVLFGDMMAQLLEGVARKTGIAPDEFQITFTHTHAAGLLDPARTQMPGGHLIVPYFDQLIEQIGNAVLAAVANLQPTWIVYGQAHSNLAAHRDFWDEKHGRFVCGFNPDGPADDTVLVARFSDADGRMVATVVNYACHPTTLAWQNQLISADFPGAMRDTIEAATGAPCIFLQGASGDLGPREGFVGEVAVAERNGRQLAYTALSALEALPAPATRFKYAGPVMSGTAIGTWRHVGLDDASVSLKKAWRSCRWHVNLRVRQDLPTRSAVTQQLAKLRASEATAVAASNAAAAHAARVEAEKLQRELNRLDSIPASGNYPFEVSVWQIGDAFWVAVEAEPYQQFQVALRKRHPGVPIVVIALTNSRLPTYLPPAEAYGAGIYQETIALLAAGSLETLTQEVEQQIEMWLGREEE